MIILGPCGMVLSLFMQCLKFHQTRCSRPICCLVLIPFWESIFCLWKPSSSSIQILIQSWYVQCTHQSWAPCGQSLRKKMYRTVFISLDIYIYIEKHNLTLFPPMSFHTYEVYLPSFFVLFGTLFQTMRLLVDYTLCIYVFELSPPSPIHKQFLIITSYSIGTLISIWILTFCQASG